ncbi:MRN complex-interacting protein isoform X2 [Latimeria chalumnae]|uniref:MRN complex interacting protein n=1 Tax=Latimeria chalumnae TaxID=7897 RepID=H3AVW3_LATCH|nr:PREDICTED: UPF0544 protein C5orf45 homolog isoform X2 [Latimeria chalumnae]|eukprot:XP_014343540.1 PREDICTED: UPF0544 protein C5orf45 homolog isoform X2 [Latimeria chalumnae]
MVQEFQVLRCFSCKTFQVHQVKKCKKWSCKVCGEKQSLIKVYSQGTGADCRRHVQKLNMVQGQMGCEAEMTVWKHTKSFGISCCGRDCFEVAEKSDILGSGNKKLRGCENWKIPAATSEPEYWDRVEDRHKGGGVSDQPNPANTTLEPRTTGCHWPAPPSGHSRFNAAEGRVKSSKWDAFLPSAGIEREHISRGSNPLTEMESPENNCWGTSTFPKKPSARLCSEGSRKHRGTKWEPANSAARTSEQSVTSYRASDWGTSSKPSSAPACNVKHQSLFFPSSALFNPTPRSLASSSNTEDTLTVPLSSDQSHPAPRSLANSENARVSWSQESSRVGGRLASADRLLAGARNQSIVMTPNPIDSPRISTALTGPLPIQRASLFLTDEDFDADF